MTSVVGSVLWRPQTTMLANEVRSHFYKKTPEMDYEKLENRKEKGGTKRTSRTSEITPGDLGDD